MAVHLPGLSGLDLQQELAKANIESPIIFITDRGDIPICVRALKAGALEFLTKPFDHKDLLDARWTSCLSCLVRKLCSKRLIPL